MKIYPKTYEDVFRSKRTSNRCDIDKVCVDSCAGYTDSVDVYSMDLHNEIKKLQIETFSQLVKIEWLYRRFRYEGVRRKNRSNGHRIDRAFGIFMRNYVGYDPKLLSLNRAHRIVAEYLDDFFPDFNSGNPFEIKFEYPYKYMNFECLVLVYRMEERMELLKIGEDQQMRYVDFLDYIINYIMSYNEEYGEKFTLSSSITIFRYVSLINYEK